MIRRERPTWMLALALVGLLIGLANGWHAPVVLNGPLARAFAPLANGLRGVRGAVGTVLVSPGQVASLRAALAAREAELAKREVEATQLGQLKRENDRFRALLGFKRDRGDLDLVGASVRADVVGGEPGGLSHGVWIDQGTSDGVAAGNPVVTERGLVGRVARPYANTSQVLLMTDGASAVGARVERSGATGMVFGSAGGTLTLRYVPQDAPGMPPNVVVGDVIHTSGLDGSNGFPRMVPIGQVIEVRQSDERPNQEAVVRPFVDLASVELVLVVTSWRPVPLPDEAAMPATGTAQP